MFAAPPDSPFEGPTVDLRRDSLLAGSGTWMVGVVLYLSACFPLVGWTLVAIPLVLGVLWRVVRRHARWLTIASHGLVLGYGRELPGDGTPARREVVPFADLEAVEAHGVWIALYFRDGLTRWVPCRRDAKVVEDTVAQIRTRLGRYREAEADAPPREAARAALQALIENPLLP
ncbi:MAG: hypothetical protein AAGA48_30225 [Myxococcota bacterium]